MKKNTKRQSKDLTPEVTGTEVAQWLGTSPSAVSKGLNQVKLRSEKGGASKIVKEILQTS
jgi:hypothetical protein